MYLPRHVEKEVGRWLKGDKIIIVRGPRQSGKTTLIKHIQEVYGGTYLDAQLPKTKLMINSDSLLKLKQPIFIDEIGEIENAGKFLKMMYDEHRIKFVVTGSGAFELRNPIGGSLVGRAIYITLYPLSFSEFVMWKKPELYKYFSSYKQGLWDFIMRGKEILPSNVEIGVEDMFLEYLKWGGYPSVVLGEEKEKIIANLVETALEKDLFSYFDIRNKRKFLDILNLLSTRVGNLLNISSFNMHYNTVQKYLSLLENEFFIHLLPPFHKNLSTELRKAPKVFFIDNGIGNFINPYGLSQGQLFENFVFSQLIHSVDKRKIRYWRTEHGAEVDFILLLKEIIPVEVKSTPKVSKSLRSFISQYKPKRAIILSSSNSIKLKEVDGCKVLMYPLWFI